MAGSPGGQVIGRVSVKVLPDTSDFGERLERQLKREVGKSHIKIKIEAELDKASLDKIKQDLQHWQRKVNPIKVQVKPELHTGSTTYINGRLAYLSRMRSVPILPYLVPGSVQKVSAGIGTMIAALSGGRVIRNIVDDFTRWAKSLDEAAPKIGIVAQGLVGIIGLGLTAGSNLFALSASLAQIGAIGLTLPATFASAAIGVGVLIAAMKDFNTVLPEVKTQLSKLQDLISKNFWAEAKAPFQEMITNLFPKFSAGLAGVSTQLGSLFGSIASSLGASLAPTVGSMFTQLANAIQVSSGVAGPLASAIATIGQQGAAYLPRMAQWIVDITSRFDEWLTRVSDSGQFSVWVENGLTALSSLGSVLFNLGGILSGIADAASAAGGSGLGLMAQTLERVHKAVDTPAFQTGLVNVLTAAHQAMSTIATTAGPAFATFMETLGHTFTVLLPIAGQAIGTLVAALSTALSNPAFVQGFTALIDGVGQAIKGLAPALTPIGGMLGSLGAVLGTFLASLGPVLGDVLGSLAGAFQSILPALQPVIGVLTGALGGAFKMLAPVITLVAESIASLVSGSILPALVTGIGALLPVIGVLAPIIANVLSTALSAIAPLFGLVAQALVQIAPLFGELLVAIAPLVSALLPALGAILGAVVPVLAAIITAILPPLIAGITALVGALVPVINVIAQVVVWLLDKLTPVLTFVAGLLISVVTGVLNGFTNIFNGIMGIWEGFKQMFSGGWSNFFAGLGTILIGIWNIIIGAIEVILNVLIISKIVKFFGLAKTLFSSGWTAIKAIASNVWNAIKGAIGAGLNGVKNLIVNGVMAYINFWRTGFANIQFIVGSAFSIIKTKIGQGISAAVGLVRELPGKAVAALGNIGSSLANAGRQLIEGFIGGIKAKFDGVKETLQGLTKKLTDWKGPESLDRVLLVPVGQLIIDGLITGLESRYDGVRRSLQGLTSDIASTVIDSPQIADLSGSYGAISANLSNPAGMAGAAAQGKTEINVSMDSNSSPEDVADAILFAQKRLAYGSAYAM